MKVSLYRRGRVWWARYRDRRVIVRRSLKTDHRKIAEDQRVELEYALRRGLLGPRTDETRVETFLTDYSDYSRAHKREKSHATDMGRLRDFAGGLESRFVSEVTTADVSRFLSRKVLEDSVSPTTVLRYRETIHAFFAHAKRMNHTRENPVSSVPRPKVPERDVRFLSLDQIEELFKAVRGDLIEPLVRTAVYAGLRREELCWLTFEDLELEGERPCLRVRAKSIDGESWLPKTKRNRTIPISTKLLATLRSIATGGGPWFFPSPEGKRWDPDNLAHRLHRLMRKAGMPWGFLDLRHTFGSQLARKGVSLLKISQLMGNSPEIARRHYVRLIPEEMHADVEF